MRCEHCAAPLALSGPRSRACPRCKAAFYALQARPKGVEIEASGGGRNGTAVIGVDRLEALTAKPIEPEDLLSVEVFRCPLCSHGIVLGTVADVAREGGRFLLRLPRKRTAEVRCEYCGRSGHAHFPSDDPLEVPVVPLKRDSFDYQVDQFLRQPPPSAGPERSGCLGLLLSLLLPR